MRQDLVETVAEAIRKDREAGYLAATVGAKLGRCPIDTMVFALILPQPTADEREAIWAAVAA